MCDQLHEEASDQGRNNKHKFIASLSGSCFFCDARCNKTLYVTGFEKTRLPRTITNI